MSLQEKRIEFKNKDNLIWKTILEPYKWTLDSSENIEIECTQ